MPEDVTKRVQIVFGTGLPLGTRGLFTYQGQRWIALPQTKHQALCTVTDRMIGALEAIQRDLTRMLAEHPGDATRIGHLLGVLARAEQFRQQALTDKTIARTA